MINYIQIKNKTGFTLAHANWENNYLSNGRLNPAVIRCNIEPAAGHLYLQLTIIPRARVVHELIANEARSASLAINSLRRERVE